MATISLGEGLKKFIQHSAIKNGLYAAQVQAVWADIMGKTIANYTENIQIMDSKLIIHTQVAPLKTELLYQKENIIKRVNEELGEKIITELIVK